MDLSNIFSRWTSQSSKDIYLGKDDRQLQPQLIWSQASCLATGLVGLGLQPGEGVLVWMRSVPEVLVAFVAVQLAGGCFVPAPQSLNIDDLVKLVDQSRSAMAIISLDLYDRYHEMETKLKSVRDLVVDAGEASAETTLPSNARSLTPMLMVGRDVTLPDIESHTRSLYYIPKGTDKPVEIVREEGRWSGAVEAAENSFKKGETVLNMADLAQPEALLLGALWPLLAGASVVVHDPNDLQIDSLMKEKKPNTLVLDADSAAVFLENSSGAEVSRVLWCCLGIEKVSERLSKLLGAQVLPLKDAADPAGLFT